MNLTLAPQDFFALSPLLLILFTAVGLLLLESFAKEFSKNFSFPIASLGLFLSFLLLFYVPISQNRLLTPWLRFDSLAKIFTGFFIIIGLASAFLADAFFKRHEAQRGEFYFLLLSSIFGLILIGEAADFLTLFLGLETLSISLYILCGYMKRWKAAQEASAKYFLIGALAAAFLLYGIALIYGATGATNFGVLLDAAKNLSAGTSQALFYSGIAFVTVGLAFKAAIVPFHAWAPDVYEGAPTPVTAFMSVGTKTGAFAAFGVVFLLSLPGFNPIWNEMIALLAYPTLLYANFVALRQVELKRFFAYSGISHAGFMLIPLAASTPDALPALLFYLAVYGLATLGAFAALAFADKSEGIFLKDLEGFFYTSPYLGSLLAFSLLTLAGIPPTAGFFAKFYLFKLAFETGYYGLLIAGLLMAILSAFYYLRIIAATLKSAKGEEISPSGLWPALLVGSCSFAALLALSFYPAPLLALLKP